MFEPAPENEQDHEITTPQTPVSSSIPKLKLPAIALAVALGVGGAGAYSIHEHGVAREAQQQNAAMQQSLTATNAQIAQLTAKLNELTAPKPTPEVAQAPAPKPHVTKAATHRTRASRRADDPRWKKVQAQLDAQGKAIDATRQDLTTAKTELNDSIARTHGELVVLQKKGERNYTEFDLDKTKQFAYRGSVGIRLRKANVKHQYADLELLVDDRSLTKKHVNIYEPAMFYSADSELPIQVVINSISKNHIRGYVSEPKYRRSDLTAMSGDPNETQPQQARQRLSFPK